jgi:cytochrome c553
VIFGTFSVIGGIGQFIGWMGHCRTGTSVLGFNLTGPKGGRKVGRIKKIAMVAGLLAGTGILSLVACTHQRAAQNHGAVPLPDIQASDDPEIIEKGAYYVYAIGQCTFCHVSDDARLQTAKRPPLSGSDDWVMEPGVMRGANLTPDPETGIGKWSDGELARALRSGVLRDGSLSVFMRMHGPPIADDDLQAVISYLRAQPPVKKPIPRTELNLMGKAMKGFVFKPQVAPAKYEKAPPRAPTPERGEYLASAAMCVFCHSKASPSPEAGSIVVTGDLFAGGECNSTEGDKPMKVCPPNLTPHPEKGHLRSWTEEVFVQRFKAGKTIPGRTMPWETFQNMDEADLRALWRYLKTVKPSDHDPGPMISE